MYESNAVKGARVWLCSFCSNNFPCTSPEMEAGPLNSRFITLGTFFVLFALLLFVTHTWNVPSSVHPMEKYFKRSRPTQPPSTRRPSHSLFFSVPLLLWYTYVNWCDIYATWLFIQCALPYYKCARQTPTLWVLCTMRWKTRESRPFLPFSLPVPLPPSMFPCSSFPPSLPLSVCDSSHVRVRLAEALAAVCLFDVEPCWIRPSPSGAVLPAAHTTRPHPRKHATKMDAGSMHAHARKPRNSTSTSRAGLIIP